MKSRLDLLTSGGCSRRAVLQGLGAAALGSLVACGSSNAPTGASTMCGTGLCLDLADPANKELTTVGGALVVDSPSDTIMVIRESDTSVIALSAICTHAGCECTHNASSHRLECPCHGSVFGENGQVINGPARRALRVYTATLANQTITITL